MGISRCILVDNVVTVGQIRYELSHEQAEFPRILSQNGQNDFEGQRSMTSISNNQR